MEDQELPIFGKGVLPSVSEGMYRDSFFLFREYIQNSADSIDEAIRQGILNKNEAQIEISIDEEERRIVIQDNGIGISKDLAKSYLVNVGDSKKDPKVCKGRFGIGRLGGLGYCGRIIFETSAKGEKFKSRVVWNAAQLRELINDSTNDSDAITAIQHVTEYRREECDENSHYFTVTLEKVLEAHDELLDLDEVRKYLSQTAPVAFDKTNFRFSDKIYKFLEEENLSLCEYRVNLNNDPVYKCYEDVIQYDDSKKKKKSIEIKDVYLHLIKKDQGSLWGWYWFARTDTADAFSKLCYVKGLRLKQWNIQIGEDEQPTLKKLWKEDRGNSYFVGEIHVLDINLIPNSRRDYFRTSEECRAFESELRTIFFELDKLYHTRSNIQAQGNKFQKVRELEDSFNKRENNNSFLNDDDRSEALEKLKVARANAEDAKKDRKKLEDNFLFEGESREVSKSSGVFSQKSTDSSVGMFREIIRSILREEQQADSSTIQEDESKRPQLETRKVPQLPSKLKKNRRVDCPLDAGERALLTKVREVLQENLKTKQFNNIWPKIMNRICGQEEDREVQ